MRLFHTILPYFNGDSEILILGSFPSVKSRETGFYYGHKQNRFWAVLSSVFEDSLPTTVDDKKAFLSKHKIALWDVIESCDIVGSSDASIKNVAVNDVASLLKKTNIKRIVVNGGTALKLYNEYLLPTLKIQPIAMPSTSPANASYSKDRLIQKWAEIKLR